MSKITILDVADYFMTHPNIKKSVHSKLKVQTTLSRLCYLFQGFYLGLYQQPVFEEDFEGWVCGPVSNYLIDNYKLREEYSTEADFDQTHIKVFDEVRYYLSDFKSPYHIEFASLNNDAYEKSRVGMDRLEPGHNIITKEDMLNTFIVYFDYKDLKCPSCNNSNAGKYSNKNNLNIIECNDCDNRYIYTESDGVFSN